jgi:arginyl-tRNA synthetase
VIQPDQPELSAARLLLCNATKQTLKAALSVMGISAPEAM